MNLTQALEQLRRDVRLSGRSPHTVRAYTNDILTVAAFLDDAMDTDVGLLDAGRLKDAFSLFAETHANSSVVRARAAWRRLFDVLVEEGALETSPMAGVAAKLHATKSYPKPLVGWENNVGPALLAGSSNAPENSRSAWALRDRALLGLLLATGIRSGEVAALTLGSLLRDDRGGADLVVWGKGHKQRTLPLGGGVVRLVDAYLEERREKSVLWTCRESDPLFVAKRSLTTGEQEPLSTNQIAYVVRRVARQAGLGGIFPPGASVHALRHTFGSQLARSREPLHHIAAIMGHASLSTTQGYLQPVHEDMEKALERHAKDLGL